MTEIQQYEAWVKQMRELRKKYVSQSSMAREMGMTQGSLSRILSGKRSGIRIWQRHMEAKGAE